MVHSGSTAVASPARVVLARWSILAVSLPCIANSLSSYHPTNRRCLQYVPPRLIPQRPSWLPTQDIETMLADCGPIKRIDLIKTTDAETGAKRSRGFGFVTFALESDATKAVSIIHRKRSVNEWGTGFTLSQSIISSRVAPTTRRCR